MKIKKNNQKGGQPPSHRYSEAMRRMREERERAALARERTREYRAALEERERARNEEREE